MMNVSASVHVSFRDCCVPLRCAGLVASLQANELPNPVVEVCVSGNHAYKAYEIAAARTLQVIAHRHDLLAEMCNACEIVVRSHECLRRQIQDSHMSVELADFRSVGCLVLVLLASAVQERCSTLHASK